MDEQEFEVTTTAQVERTYRVRAADEDAAHKRLRRYIEDPDMIREDLVQVLDDRTKDVTPQKVKTASIKAVTKPQVVAGGSGRGGEAKAS